MISEKWESARGGKDVRFDSFSPLSNSLINLVGTGVNKKTKPSQIKEKGILFTDLPRIKA